MRLSGVDPGIIRELSGIYKPFIKAFKELISNAYDADAKRIIITLAENFSNIDVLDDGIGMTPYQFHQDFARLGGSTAWLRDGKSPGGRARIGYKGIGFLAVARYCKELHVETHSLSPYEGTQIIARRNRKKIPLVELAGDLVPDNFLFDRIKVISVTGLFDTGPINFHENKDYETDGSVLRLLTSHILKSAQLQISYQVDCRDVVLNAVVDFDYLLSLERRADLRLLDDFCRVTLRPSRENEGAFTRVRLHQLKEFVVRELSAPAVKGKARNIVFKSGKDQFLWRLARTSPIMDDIPSDINAEPFHGVAEYYRQADLPRLSVKWRNDEITDLARPIYLARDHSVPLGETTVLVDIDEAGLRVIGYLLARSEVLYPAEFRGISIRVRNVAIGDANYLGWEHILSGPQKAVMSQVTGELIVLSGLEASDAINPGRESFYEENTHYRILKQRLFGSEENIGGYVGQAIRQILDRIHVRSQVTDKITEARQRRKTLADISSAVSFYSRAGSPTSKGLSSFFQSNLKADGLATTRNVPLLPGTKLGGFEVEESSSIAGDFEIDFQNRKVRLDFRQDTWATSVYLHGHYYEVMLKHGKPEHPICEFDNEKRRIYVNWTHPVKLHMNDVAFLKSAILLRLAYHAAPRDADTMMDLALNMLAFRAE